MPKLNGRPPKYRHHKSTKRGYVEFQGRPIYLGRFNTPASWERYHRIIHEWLASGRIVQPEQIVGLASATHGVQVRGLILAFWRHAKIYYRKPDGTPTSELNTQKQALRVLRRLYGRTPAADFGPKRLKAVREAMIAKGWSRPHINKQISRIKSMFRWAVENELVPAGAHQALLAVKHLRKGRCGDVLEPKPVEPVGDEHVACVLPYLPAAVAAMVRFQLVTGMRPQEVVNIRGCEIDRSNQVWLYRPAHHKTAHHGKSRDIYLGAQAQEILRPYLKLDPTAHLFSPAESERGRNNSRHGARETPANQGACIWMSSAKIASCSLTWGSVRKRISGACSR
jgi:integrase